MHAFNDVVSAVFDHSFAVNSEVDLFLRHFDRELGGRRRRTRRTNSQDAGDRSITTKDNGKNHIDCNFDPSDANNKSNSHGNHHHTHTEINVVEHELLRAEKYANRVSNELCDTVAYHCQNHLAELNQTIRATNEFLDISLHKGIAMQKKRERRMMANAEDLQQIKDRIGK